MVALYAGTHSDRTQLTPSRNITTICIKLLNSTYRGTEENVVECEDQSVSEAYPSESTFPLQQRLQRRPPISPETMQRFV